MVATGEGVVLGIDFGATKTAIALAVADGTLLERVEIPTVAESGAETTVWTAVELGKALAAKTDAALLGVGVSSMGITLEDRVVLAPNVSGWEQLALPGILHQAFPWLPVRIENDIKAATFAELRWGALRGVEIGMYVNLGSGIGVGLVLDGRVLRGAHGAAGEIAFNPRSPNDEQGFQAGRAPLEEFVGGISMAQRARTRFGLDPGDLFSRYGTDVNVTSFIDDYISEISFHLANLAIALDMTHIVLGAGLMRSESVVLPLIADRIRQFTLFPVTVVGAHFRHDAALYGAIALATAVMPAL